MPNSDLTFSVENTTALPQNASVNAMHIIVADEHHNISILQVSKQGRERWLCGAKEVWKIVQDSDASFKRLQYVGALAVKPTGLFWLAD